MPNAAAEARAGFRASPSSGLLALTEASYQPLTCFLRNRRGPLLPSLKLGLQFRQSTLRPEMPLCLQGQSICFGLDNDKCVEVWISMLDAFQAAS
jgi:hypothetical protein